MRRAALPSSGLYPLAVLTLTFLAYGSAPRPCTPPASRRCTSRRWCSATCELPHRGGHPLVRRGGRLAGPDRALRDARAAALPGPAHPRRSSGWRSSRAWCSPSSRARCRCWSARWCSRCRGASCRSCRGPGCAVRSRSCSPRSRWPRGSTGSQRLFDLVFVMVVIYTLLTGPTLPMVARVLKVARRSEPRGLEMEAAPLERVAADLLQVTISPVSRMHGVEVGELRLPQGASVSMVIRDGRDARPRASDRAAARRRAAGGDPAQAARAHRAAAAPGQRGRPAGPVAGGRRRPA